MHAEFNLQFIRTSRAMMRFAPHYWNGFSAAPARRKNQHVGHSRCQSFDGHSVPEAEISRTVLKF